MPQPSAPPGVAVVELFTSEGCSSCPAADKLLAKLADEAAHDHRAVIVLAFHVDYWDYIGWKDPFASAEFSARQRRYAEVFHSRQIYTPQMIVNGKAEFVGSDERQARREIDQGLAAGAAATLTIRDLKAANNEVSATVVIDPKALGTNRKWLLNAALVQDHLVSDVKRVENAGRKLEHSGVVRAFRSFEIDASGAIKVSLDPPSDLILSDSALIVFAQDSRSLVIAAASRQPLAPTTSRPSR